MLSCGRTGKSLSSSCVFILMQIACRRVSRHSGVSGAVLFHLGSWKPEAFPRTLVDRLRKNTSFQTSRNKKGWQEGIITLSEPGLWVGTVTFQKSRRLCCVMIGKRMEGRAPDIIDCTQFLGEGRVRFSKGHSPLPATLPHVPPLGAGVLPVPVLLPRPSNAS